MTRKNRAKPFDIIGATQGSGLLESMDGVMLVGSAAYGARDPNDIDMVIVTNDSRLPHLIRRAIELFPVKNLTSQSRLGRLEYLDHAHSFKGEINDQQISFWIYTPELIESTVAMERERIDYVRETPNAGEATLYNVLGKTTARPITNSSDGALIIATEPNFAYDSEYTYFGILPDALLKGPQILQDRTGFMEQSLGIMWDNVLATIAKETNPRTYQHIMKTGTLPLIRRQADFAKELSTHMQEQLAKARARFEY